MIDLRKYAVLQKYRHKPSEIEAFRWGGESLPPFKRVPIKDATDQGWSYKLLIFTGAEWGYASIGDYIIQNAKGRLSICTPEVFRETYEIVEETPDLDPCGRVCIGVDVALDSSDRTVIVARRVPAVTVNQIVMSIPDGWREEVLKMLKERPRGDVRS